MLPRDGLYEGAHEREGWGVEFVRQEAHYPLAVVEHQRPIGHEEVVVLRAVDDLACLRRIVDEILQSLPEAASPVDLVFDAYWHVHLVHLP